MSEQAKKIKVMVIGDHLLAPSGVANQLRYVVDALYETGDFSFVYVGGAVKHENYTPQRFDKYGDDLTLYPVDGYGTPDIVRSLLKTERPDILFFMTDPRFYEWLWLIENEVRQQVPMVYFHVWDNFPVPKYNKKYLSSNDVIIPISKLTDKICKELVPEVPTVRLGHTVNTDVFKPLGGNLKEALLPQCKDKFVLFYNGRNARRKMVGTMLVWFRDFLDIVGEDKASFLLHTDPHDPHGANLQQIVKDFNLGDEKVLFSTTTLNEHQLAQIYNAVDLSINLSDAEGFGLCVLESLACETPVLVGMTGGPQEQVTDGKNWFGRGLRPSSQMIVGTQHPTPYIFEDRYSKEDFLKNTVELYKKWNKNHKEYNKMGKLGRKHVLKNYGFDKFKKGFVNTMKKIHEDFGSWETRKGYKPWAIKEIK